MPYDPFAPAPTAAPMPAPPAAMPPVAMPPPPLDPGNALASVVAPPVDAPMVTTSIPATDPAHPMSYVGANGHIADMNGFRQALMSWRGGRPQFSYDPTSDASRQDQRSDFRTARSDWRSQRPDLHSYMNMPAPPTSVGMVPGVPGSMGTNPNGNPGIVPPMVPPQPPMMTPGGGGTGAPLQGQGWRGPRYRGA